MSGAVPSLPHYAFVSCKGTSLSLRFSLFLLVTALCFFLLSQFRLPESIAALPLCLFTREQFVFPLFPLRPALNLATDSRQTARQLQSSLQSVRAIWRLLAGLTATGVKYWSFSLLFKWLSTVH